MKTKKRLFSFLLALATVLALITVPAKKVEAGSAPAKVRTVVCYQWEPDTGNPVIAWKGVSADGYQVEIKTLGGKLVKRVTTSSTMYYFYNLKTIKNAGFKVRVRAYNNVSSKKKFGSWSAAKVIVPQAKAGAKHVYYTSTATLSWKPVKNAVGYRIYILTESNGTYKLKSYKKVGKQVTSISVPRNLGKVVISPDVKVKGKTHKFVVKNFYRFYYVNVNWSF